jgi:hypothetical protein
MGAKEKVERALSHSFQDAYIRVEDDDGITGFVVSDRFRDVPTVDRQGLIERALSTAPNPLTPSEQRRVLMIAGLTPREFDAVGSRIRIHRLGTVPGGGFRVLLHGRLDDAEYVRKVLKDAGLETTAPEHSPGARGILVTFRASGTTAKGPVTKEKLLSILKKDRYIEVMPGV